MLNDVQLCITIYFEEMSYINLFFYFTRIKNMDWFSWRFFAVKKNSLRTPTTIQQSKRSFIRLPCLSFCFTKQLISPMKLITDRFFKIRNFSKIYLSVCKIRISALARKSFTRASKLKKGCFWLTFLCVYRHWKKRTFSSPVCGNNDTKVRLSLACHVCGYKKSCW